MHILCIPILGTFYYSDEEDGHSPVQKSSENELHIAHPKASELLRVLCIESYAEIMQ